MFPPHRDVDSSSPAVITTFRAYAVFVAIQLSTILLLLVPLGFQPDVLAPLLHVPPSCWCAAGCFLSLGSGWWLGIRHYFRLSAFIFVVTALLLLTDQILAVLRMMLPRQHGELRVMSWNCAGNSDGPFSFIAKEQPDAVLMQEAPGKDSLQRFSQSMGYDVLATTDCAILARGELRLLEQHPAGDWIIAEWKSEHRPTRILVSVRLAPPASCFEFWSIDCWRSHANVRATHRRQLAHLQQRLNAHDSERSAPKIIGGDFNSLPHDRVNQDLDATGVDAFRSAGRGWGGTGPSQIPLWRVDQLRISHQMITIGLQTKSTTASDHAYLIADLIETRQK